MPAFTVPDLRFEESFVAKAQKAAGAGQKITSRILLETAFSTVFVDPLVQSFVMAFVWFRLQPMFKVGQRMGASVVRSFGSIFRVRQVPGY